MKLCPDLFFQMSVKKRKRKEKKEKKQAKEKIIDEKKK